MNKPNQRETLLEEELFPSIIPSTSDLEDVSKYLSSPFENYLLNRYNAFKKHIKKTHFGRIIEGIKMEIDGIQTLGFFKNLVHSGEYIVLPRLTRKAINDSGRLLNPNNSLDMSLYPNGDLMLNMPQQLFKDGYIHYSEVDNQGFNINKLKIDVATLNQSYKIPSQIRINFGSSKKKSFPTPPINLEFELDKKYNLTLYNASKRDPTKSAEENLEAYEKEL